MTPVINRGLFVSSRGAVVTPMIDITKLHPEVGKLLMAAGWSLDRRVEVSDVVSILEREGFRPNSAAVELLTSLHGIYVDGSRVCPFEREIKFDTINAASGEYDRTVSWREKLNVDFFPLGRDVRSGSAIWCGSDGRFYIGLEFGLYGLGDTI